FDPFNTSDGLDGWNRENFSLLGPGGAVRFPGLLARPYPLQSAARPTLIRFDTGPKVAAFAFAGPLGEGETRIHVPCSEHFQAGFEVRISSGDVRFDRATQTLSWSVKADSESHALVLSPPGALHI